jgi:putative endonuclease
VYFETHSNVLKAIQREKEIKKWRREKKDALITLYNKDWDFLNDSV